VRDTYSGGYDAGGTRRDEEYGVGSGRGGGGGGYNDNPTGYGSGHDHSRGDHNQSQSSHSYGGRDDSYNKYGNTSGGGHGSSHTYGSSNAGHHNNYGSSNTGGAKKYDDGPEMLFPAADHEKEANPLVAMAAKFASSTKDEIGNQSSGLGGIIKVKSFPPRITTWSSFFPSRTQSMKL
jgi:hypothetical protein